MAEAWVRPRTIVGQWLMAMMQWRLEDRDRLQQQLNVGGQRPWKYDEPGMVEIAATLAVRKLLPGDASDAQIAALAEDLSSQAPANKGVSRELNEKVIRSALGQRDISYNGVSKVEMFSTQGAFVMYAFVKLQMDEGSIAHLIADAERTAFERGWNPPLADE